MNKKTLFLILVFTLSITTVLSQTETTIKRNQLEFLTGYNSGSLQNLSLAPVSRYDYNGLNYQFKYVRSTIKENLFEVQLDYLNSELKSDLIPSLNIKDYSKIVLNVSYIKRVYIKNRFTIHIGLQTQSNISSFFQFRVYDVQQKLGIASRFTFLINEKQALSSKLTLPFFLFRTSTFEENFYSLSKYQSILWATEYTYKLSNHVNVRANYNFNYDRLQISNAFRELQHQINLGINFKF